MLEYMRYRKYAWREYNPQEVYISYGDIEPCNKDEAEFVEIPSTTHSDYSGCAVEHVNCEYIKEEFENLLGNGMHIISGRYNTEGIVITIDCYNGNLEIRELIEGLLDYPLIDDELLSEYEYNLFCEHIEDELDHLTRSYDNIKLDIGEVIQFLFDNGVEYYCEIPHSYPCVYNLDELLQQALEELSPSVEVYINGDSIGIYKAYMLDDILDKHALDNIYWQEIKPNPNQDKLF